MNLPEVAAAAHISPSQLRHWVQLGIVSPIAEPRAQRVRYTWEPEDIAWAIAVADLVRAGMDVGAIAAWVRLGRVVEVLDLFGPTVAAARAAVPWYILEESA